MFEILRATKTKTLIVICTYRYQRLRFHSKVFSDIRDMLLFLRYLFNKKMGIVILKDNLTLLVAMDKHNHKKGIE